VTVDSTKPPLNPTQIKAEIAALEKELNVDTLATNKSRDAEENGKPAAPPSPIVDDEPLQLRPSLFDKPVGPLQ
jgi:hypothetical protein